MKKISYILLLVIGFMITLKVNAFSINGPSYVYVGENIAVTVEAYGLTGRFDITSNNGYIASGGTSDWLENQTKTYYFTATGVGCANITVNATNVSDSEGNEISGSRITTVCVQERYVPQQIYVNRTYSDNNNLSGLNIDGYELTPGFNKDTLEYTVELIPGTEKININTSLESDVASVRGNGEVEVTDGMNTINITVIAENGNEKTYVIKAHMEEKDPIIIKMDNEEYTLIKKREYIKPIDGYKESTVKIKGFDIPTLYNEITGYTLVGLKDSDGNINMYLYDAKNGEYKDYVELTYNRINLFILKDEDSKYEQVNIKIGNEDVIAYKYKGSKDYYLLYGTNTNTGATGYYLYDSIEDTVQRYSSDILDSVMLEKNKYFTLIIILSSICFVTMLFLLIFASKKNED